MFIVDSLVKVVKVVKFMFIVKVDSLVKVV